MAGARGRPRAALLHLTLLAIVLQQVRSQQAVWSPVGRSASSSIGNNNFPSNLVYQSRARTNIEVQPPQPVQQPQQQLVLVPADQHYRAAPSNSDEYYDEEYYDDDAPPETVVKPQIPPQKPQPPPPQRDSKVIRTEPVQQQQQLVNKQGVKPVQQQPQQQQQQPQYDDSEYYTDYEELEEDPKASSSSSSTTAKPKEERQPVVVPVTTSSSSSTSTTSTTTTTTTTTTTEAPSTASTTARSSTTAAAAAAEQEEDDEEAELEEEEELDEVQPVSSSSSSTTAKPVQEPSEKKDSSILIGEAIVSVVTTKSVVNGTYSVPDFTESPPSSTEAGERSSPETTASTSTTSTSTTASSPSSTVAAPSTTSTSTTGTSSSSSSSTEEASTEASSSSSAAPSTSTTSSTTSAPTTSSSQPPPPSTTIQAALPTGRSVSGARFLPFPSLVDPASVPSKNEQQQQLDSTESINDKLDRVQSELSSGFLNGGRFVPARRYTKKPFSITSLTLPSTSTVAPTSSPIAPITITSITKRPRVQTTLDDISALLPKDYRKSYTTTLAPITRRPKVQTTLDDIDAFLPKDFTKGGSYKTSTQSSGITKRPKYQTTQEDVDAFLPKDYPKGGSYRNKRPGGYKTTPTPTTERTTTTTTSTTPSTTTTSSTTNEKVVSSTERTTGSTRPKTLTTIEDISAFLPPGYKLKKEDATTEKSAILSEILAKTKLHNGSVTTSTAAAKTTTTGTAASTTASANLGTTEKTKSIEDLFAKSAGVDISALLPPGYKPAESSSSPKPAKLPIQELLSKSSVDISALLPPGYKSDNAKSTKSIKTEDPVQDLIVKSNVDISALLPPGFSGADKKEPSHSEADAPDKSLVSKIVFPSRPGSGTRKPLGKVTTARPGGGIVDTAAPVIHKGWPVRATTEFTGWPTSSTTPISIEKLLEAARTATISSTNVSSVPITSEISSTSSTTTTTTTTIRPTTPGMCDENCEVAGTIKIIDNAVWVPELLDRNTREWQDLAEEIEREMNLVFAKSPVLRKWYRNIRIDSFSQGSVLVDYFVELADMKEKINTQQLKVIFHDSLRTFNFDDPMEVGPKGPVKLGKFTIDPKSTDFVVIPRVAAPKVSEDDNKLIPQWAIAVIVIGVGGLLFTIVFGVSVLVNRQHGSKLKPSITAMFEEEAAKNAMSHSTAAAPPSRPPASDYHKSHDSHTMWSDAGWHDKPFESTSHKFLVDGLPYERKYNMYDSWKSEWNGYYYPPTHASSSNFSRHHPDYDYNF